MAFALTAIPYCGPAPIPTDVWAQWNLDPLILAPLAIGAVWLAVNRGLTIRSRTTGALALAVLAVAFVSPICALSSALFAARTLHHILLICIAAPLIAGALPRVARPGFATIMIATLLQAAVLWFWHAPVLYEAALSNDLVYALMELTLLGASVLFWAALRATSAPAAALGLVLTMVQMGLLGALLVFAGSAVYAPHLTTTAAWGLTALEDQQLAGLIMWAPAAGLYLVAALVAVARWIGPDPASAAAPAKSRPA